MIAGMTVIYLHGCIFHPAIVREGLIKEYDTSVQPGDNPPYTVVARQMRDRVTRR
jgi:hypothetical protein